MVMKQLRRLARIRKGKLEAKVNFPNLRITMESHEPVNSLKELNKIIHTLKAIEFNRDYCGDLDEDPLYFRLGYLSEELRNHQESMDFIRSALKVEESFKMKKLAIENTKILDFRSNQYTSTIDHAKIKPKIHAMLKGMDLASYVFVHVIGSGTPDEKESIIDLIRNRIPRAEVKTLFTNKELLTLRRQEF